MTHEGRVRVRRALGLAALLAAVDFLLWGGAFTMHGYSATFASEDIRICYTVPGMVVLGALLVLLAVACRRGGGLGARGCALGSVGMLAADVLLGVMHVACVRSLPLLTLAGVMAGAGIAASLLAWHGALRLLARAERMRVVCAACLLFPLVPLAFALARSAASFVVTGALCVASAALLPRAASVTCGAAAAGVAASRPGLARALRQSLPPALCLVSLGFVAGLARTSALSAEAGSAPIMWWSLGCMFAIAAGLLLVWRVAGTGLTIVRFYLAGFVLTATSLVGALVVANGFTAALACCPYLILEFALVLVMASGDEPAGLPRADGAPVPTDEDAAAANDLLAFGVQTGGAYLALALGTALGLALCRGEGGAPAAFGLSIGLCVYALSVPLVALLGRRPPALAPAPAPPAPTEPRDIYAARARRLADAYGLTPREEQIVVLTACGLDLPALARELGVSDNTVRTHRRNAYKKLGAHSKQDVLALLAAEAGAPGLGASGPARP